MDPQGLANTAWAFATSGHAAPAFFEELTKQASEGRLREFKPLELANTAWACAKGNVSSPALFEAIAEQMLGRVFLSFVFVCVLFVFCVFLSLTPSVSPYVTLPLFPIYHTGVPSTPARPLGGFAPQNLANTLWAFATARRPADKVFAAAEREIISRGATPPP